MDALLGALQLAEIKFVNSKVVVVLSQRMSIACLFNRRDKAPHDHGLIFMS